MAPTVDTPADWDRMAPTYESSITRFTTLHANDLLAAVLSQVQRASTVLELACGTGAFAQAYLSRFPNGIEGQTVIFSDFSPGMVSLTEKYVKAHIPSDYKTNFEFQVENACDIKSVRDGQIDLVVSLFGVFLVQPRKVVLAEVRRVLKEGGVLATSAWTSTPVDAELRQAGFGSAFQSTVGKAFGSLVEFDEDEKNSHQLWTTPDGIRCIFEEALFKFEAVFRPIHTAAFNSVDELWNVLKSSPQFDIEKIDAGKVEAVKNTLRREVGGGDGKSPVFLVTTSNVAIGSK